RVARPPAGDFGRDTGIFARCPGGDRHCTRSEYSHFSPEAFSPGDDHGAPARAGGLATPSARMASSLAMSKTRVLAVLALAALAAPAFPEEVTRRVGRLVVSVDESSAYPGGLLSVRLRSGLRYGAVHAILAGRRCPFLLSHRGLRALVPVPVDGQPGPTTLGIEVLAGRAGSASPCRSRWR